jgi:serine/threonine-protein kinase
MAPEQLGGKPFTLQSDVYSLGLLLYELFTARKAFDAPTLGELIKLRRSDPTPATPSSIVKDLDPLIEKIIDRCLQQDPDKRPASALQVAAALPGGDPLAAALAAGETPSPEMVAAAPKRGVLKPVVAAALLLSFIALLVLCAWLTKYTAVYRITPMGDSPEVLKARAREVIRHLGYTEPANDSAYALVFKADLVKYITAHDQTANRWSQLAGGGGVYRFMYRETPRYFTPYQEDIDAQSPALDVSGMTLVYLDMLGHLHWFVGVPPQREPPAEAIQRNVDWSVPFREAGLDIASFQAVASTYVPLHAYDVRTAWDGSDPSQPDVKLHVEGAAFRGRLVYFETVYPWDSPTRQELATLEPSERVLDAILLSVFALALVGSALLARRNLRLGRGDRRGATRIAFFSCGTFVVLRMLADHHTGVLSYEFGLFTTELAFGLFGAVFLWLIYVALEPFVRRQWPDRIVSWSRLLAGGFRDPLVGRDILVGSVMGAASILCLLLTFVGLRWIGRPPELTVNPANLDLGSIHFATRFVAQIYSSLLEGLIFLFLLLLFFLVLRRERLALIALWLFLIVPYGLVNQVNTRMLLFTALAAGLHVIVLARYGLLATIAAVFVVYLWVFYPMTTDLTAWYATNFLIDAGICLALAVFGFYTSLAGQPLFGRPLFEE